LINVKLEGACKCNENKNIKVSTHPKITLKKLFHGMATRKKYTEMRMFKVLNHKVLIPNSLRKRYYNPTQRLSQY